MYLRPDSNLLGEATETFDIPEHLQHFLINGYSPSLIKSKGLSLLTQHYEHPELDIYVHHIHAAKQLRLFAKAASNRLILGYLMEGSTNSCFYDASLVALSSPVMLFFKALVGKEVHLEFEAGKHKMVCCCLKLPMEKFIVQWYPMIIRQSIKPYHFHGSHLHHYQWHELLSNEMPESIYPGFVCERIRTLLRHLATEIYKLEKNQNLHLLHPEVPISVVEKAYIARQIIDQKIGQPLSLKKLSLLTRWNLQGLKQGFVQVFGISPHQYMIQERMKLALTMIEQTEEPIQTIAHICGYRRPHHFIQQFKLAYGVTPGEMRKLKN